MLADGDGPTPEAAADRVVAAVRDDPARRLRLAADFYDQRACGRDIRGYRRAEIAFMRWQIRCGVLSPLDTDQPGSPWWRAVNEGLLRDTVEADLLFNGAPGTPTTAGVGLWLTFLADPTPRTWYRAHNASIVDGYLRHRDLVAEEGPLERFFMDVALLRVLYAQCLLIRPRLALGRRDRPAHRTPLPQRRRRPERAAGRPTVHRRVPRLRLAVRATVRVADRPVADRDRTCSGRGRTAGRSGSLTVRVGEQRIQQLP